ncbi:hypothetical protein BFN03_07460 [Rhodococcus sp. WMMA185]|uniref:hypothetical protein n=1 Tax=Rhodococcus sp. WMMA185 TaxID=679318 RepID=UPI000878F732|nr:hypothetical protein [Rhodococcus sp. WMMA185]AOW92589.1 hypothetical protein BFN03_07460 [Rhodococcus sp. WMMA185]
MGGHHRQGTVTEVDGPLFRAGYLLASKAPRSAWFDSLRLLPEEQPSTPAELNPTTDGFAPQDWGSCG